LVQESWIEEASVANEVESGTAVELKESGGLEEGGQGGGAAAEDGILTVRQSWLEEGGLEPERLEMSKVEGFSPKWE